MLTFGAPAMLGAGLLAALVPLGLHLLRQRPAGRSPLPTARFLTPEPRSRIRLDRPDQPLLLAMRMLLLILVGAAFAMPGWIPRARGRAEIVLLDRAASADPARWRAAVSRARALVGDPAHGRLVVFDTAAALAAAGDPLAPGATDRSRYGAGLAALRGAAASLPRADSLRVTWISPFAAEGWSPGLAAQRAALWPGRMRLVDVGAPQRRTPPSPSTRSAAVVARAGQGGFARAALAATGTADAGGDSAAVAVVLRPLASRERSSLLARAAAGATVVLDASALAETGRARPGAGALHLAGEEPIGGADRRFALPVGAGERVLGVWDDGTAAALAARIGRGCLVRFGAPLEGGDLPLSPAYPRLLEALSRACAPAPVPGGALDAGARAILAGSGSEWVPARSVRASAAIPLWRWALAAALGLALAEVLVAGRARQRA